MRHFTMMIRRTFVLTGLVASLAVLGACGGSGSGGGDGSGDGPDAGDTGTCTPGDEGCACLEDDTCGDGLVCEAGVCEAPTDCAPGASLCACGEGDSCDEPNDVCVEGICTPRDTCDGELGCACIDDTTCDDGLTCDGGVCTLEGAVLVTLTGGDARGCDLMLETDGLHVDDVVFPAGVYGRLRTRNERAALSIIRAEDEPLTGVVAAVVFADADADTATITSLSATCFDRTGAAIDGVEPGVE